MMEDERSTLDGGVRGLLAIFCATARRDGASSAELEATSHIVAAAAYLQQSAGAERTVRILAATIATINSGQQRSN